MKSSSVFEERYKSLNPEQKKAVDTIEGPVLVVAGPGTGKTTILTLRIAQILRKTQTPPNGILAITYTNAGVKAMREKLREVIGNTAHDVYIHTFHSFAGAMISEYLDHFVKLSNFKQMTEVEGESLIRNIISDPVFSSLRPLGKPDIYIGSIVRAISDAKKDAMIPEMVSEYALKEIKRIEEDEDNISTRGATKGMLKAVALEQIEKLKKTVLFSQVYKKYEEAKQKAKLRDYDDLIIELLVALRTDELFLRLVQERFLYILVDEHQDTNDAQNYIVGIIAEFFKTPNVFVVGDEKQAIYRFQGASVENFLRLRKLWPEMKAITLSTNYRSHQSILDASFKMIENNYKENEHKDLRIELKSGSGSKSRPVDVVFSENTLAMEEYLVEEIKKIIERESKASIAIITRRNRELERVLRLLESNGIPVSSERSVDIFHHPIGSIFFDLIGYISDPTRVDLLSQTVNVGMWGLSYEESIELIHKLKSGQQGEVGSYLPALVSIKKWMLSDGAVGALIHIAEESGFTSLVSRDPAYVHVWRGIVALAESVTRDGDIQSPLELIKVLLNYRESAENKSVKVSVGAPDLQVKAMTAHGSKGLEFDYVFIPYASDEAWVGRIWGSSFALPEKNLSSHNIADIRRLFYVALTRARKHVSVLYSIEESDGKGLTPLRFITELESKSVKTISLPRADILPKINTRGEKDITQYGNLLVSEAKKVLLENGLSVTALNHFLECPNKFLYESTLKLPQALTVSAEKGSAMHEAISCVWALKDRNIENITSTITSSVGEYLERSLLSVSDKELLKKELLGNAPVVAKALFDHFSLKGQVSVERWVEAPFDGIFDNNKVTIPIHGKLDAVLETGDEVNVFDYKTRRAMSVAAIKGETQSDDGNYFRQLVFYKLLLQNNSYSRKKNILSSLVFVSPDDSGRCPTVTLPVEDPDIKKVQAEIQDLINIVWSGRIGREFCGVKDCKYCGYRRIAEK
jgi:DNA helicase II / ATP-dependent DNA helicase PcrA